MRKMPMASAFSGGRGRRVFLEQGILSADFLQSPSARTRARAAAVARRG
jgi:hypothetical protein